MLKRHPSEKLFLLSVLPAVLAGALSLSSCATGITSTSRSLPVHGPLSPVSRGPAQETQRLEARRAEAPPSFDWPVDEARLTRGFLPRKKRPHLGLDLAAKKGTPILNSRRGTVIYQGKGFRGFGKMVLVESADGWAALYAHLDKIYVAEGQKLGQGEILGAMGRTGRATGVHLHFEIRKDRAPVDPLPLLPAGRQLARQLNSSPAAFYDDGADEASERLIKAAFGRQGSRVPASE